MTLTLSTTERADLEKPIRHTWSTCDGNHAGPGCMICDGGLAICTVCGAMEGALLDSCPGVRLTVEQNEWNYRANLRRWTVEAHAHR